MGHHDELEQCPMDLMVDGGVPFTFSIRTRTDPTTWAAHLQVRDRANGLVFADLTVGAGLTIDTSARTIDAVFTAAQIAMFALQSVWDLVVTPSGESPVRLAQGRVFVSPAVSR